MQVLRCRHCQAQIDLLLGRIPQRCVHCGGEQPLPDEIRDELRRQIAVRRKADALAEDLEQVLRQTRGRGWLLVPSLALALIAAEAVTAGVLYVQWTRTGTVPLLSSATIWILIALAAVALGLLLFLPLGTALRRRETHRRLAAFRALPPAPDEDRARCRNCGATLPPDTRGLVRCEFCGARSLVDWETFRRGEALLAEEVGRTWDELLTSRRDAVAATAHLRARTWNVAMLGAILVIIVAPLLGTFAPGWAADARAWLTHHSEEYRRCTSLVAGACPESFGGEHEEGLRRTCAWRLGDDVAENALRAELEGDERCSPGGLGKILGGDADRLPALLAGLEGGMTREQVRERLGECADGCVRTIRTRSGPDRQVTVDLAFEAGRLRAARLRIRLDLWAPVETLWNIVDIKWGPPDEVLRERRGAWERRIWLEPSLMSLSAETENALEADLRIFFPKGAGPKPLERLDLGVLAGRACAPVVERLLGCRDELVRAGKMLVQPGDEPQWREARSKGCGRFGDDDPVALAEAYEACRSAPCVEFEQCVIRGMGRIQQARAEQWSPVFPLFSDEAVLAGVWSPGGLDAWAVGNDGLIVRWDQGVARVVPAPVDRDLNAIWGTSADDLWAVGAAGTILRGSGDTWEPVTSPTERDLLAVWGRSADDVWAVGIQGTAVHWDGSAWTAHETGTRQDVVAVFPPGSAGFDAVTSDGEVLRLAHGRWSSVEARAPAGIRAVAGDFTEHAWIVGPFGGLERLQDGTWVPVEDAPPGALHGVWASSPEDIWVVGRRGGAWHGDGRTWTRHGARLTDEGLQAIHVVGDDAAWVVGRAGTVLRRDARGWRAIPAGTDAPLWGVHGFADGSAWIVGANGTILRCDGDGCRPQASSTSVLVRDVWGASSDDAWIVGAYGAILHGDGTGVRSVESPTERTLYAVDGSATDDVWAVGDGGEAIHWDGQRWSRRPTGSTAKLVALDARRPDDVWALGRDGVLAHWDGADWSLLLCTLGIEPTDLAPGSDGGLCLARGSHPLLRLEGETWTSLPLPSRVDVEAVAFPATGGLWAVGGFGGVFRWARPREPSEAPGDT